MWLTRISICLVILLGMRSATTIVAVEPASKSTDPTERVIQAVYLGVNDKGWLTDTHVVEIWASNPGASLHKAVTGERENEEGALMHLLAKRGHLAALYHIASTLNEEDRRQLVSASRTRNVNGYTPMHLIVAHSKSPYWVEKFAELGFDVLEEPKRANGQSEEEWLKMTRVNREAYNRYKELQEQAKKTQREHETK